MDCAFCMESVDNVADAYRPLNCKHESHVVHRTCMEANLYQNDGWCLSCDPLRMTLRRTRNRNHNRCSRDDLEAFLIGMYVLWFILLAFLGMFIWDEGQNGTKLESCKREVTETMMALKNLALQCGRVS
jgi:hypothetical protein